MPGDGVASLGLFQYTMGNSQAGSCPLESASLLYRSTSGTETCRLPCALTGRSFLGSCFLGVIVIHHLSRNRVDRICCIGRPGSFLFFVLLTTIDMFASKYVCL